MPRDKRRPLALLKPRQSATGIDLASPAAARSNEAAASHNKAFSQSRIFDVLGVHKWMPQVRSSSSNDLTSVAEDNLIRPPGRPTKQLTREQTNALIALVVKTDLPFDDIPAALNDQVDPSDGKPASAFLIRKQWKEIFGADPEDARLGNRTGQEQRLQHHKEACSWFYKRQDAARRRQDAEQEEDEAARRHRVLLRQQSVHPRFAADTSTKTNEYWNPSRLTIQEQRRNAAASGRLFTSASNLPSPADSRSSAISAQRESLDHGQTSLKRRSVGRPKSPHEVSAKHDQYPYSQLQWYKHYRDSKFSWISRLSKNSRKSSGQGDATDYPQQLPISFSDADELNLFELLRHASSEYNLYPWAQLGGVIREYVEKGADVHAVNHAGETPLHLAVKMGCLPAVVALLEAQADPNARDTYGNSVSASARAYIKSNLLDDGTVAHIEVARELVKYNPFLEDTELKKKRRRHTRGASLLTPSPPMSLSQSYSTAPVEPGDLLDNTHFDIASGFDNDLSDQSNAETARHLHGWHIPIQESQQAHEVYQPLPSDIRDSQIAWHEDQLRRLRLSMTSAASFTTAQSGYDASARSSVGSFQPFMAYENQSLPHQPRTSSNLQASGDPFASNEPLDSQRGDNNFGNDPTFSQREGLDHVRTQFGSLVANTDYINNPFNDLPFTPSSRHRQYVVLGGSMQYPAVRPMFYDTLGEKNDVVDTNEQQQDQFFFNDNNYDISRDFSASAPHPHQFRFH